MKVIAPPEGAISINLARQLTGFEEISTCLHLFQVYPQEKEHEKNVHDPPECCVIIKMEHGVTLGYRKAVLLNEIQVLGSLTKAAKVSKIDRKHARELILEMNTTFSQPLADPSMAR